MIEFYLNGRLITLSDVDPSVTILSWLRTSVGQVGTKEGCASGDCGACSVIVAKPLAQRWHYEAVNSCIAVLASIHGKHLITVEGLADSCGDTLHRVQQAMVEHHGSQCGFCTPGIVMSLVAVLENNATAPLTEDQVLDALSGNLCRCTGYRPIVDAALNAHSYPNNNALFYSLNTDQIIAPEVSAELESVASHSVNEGVATSSYCAFPDNEQQLQTLIKRHPQARIIAGGTDLMLEQTQGFKPLPQLIGITHVSELQTLDLVDNKYYVGAAVTLSQLESAVKELPSFTQLLHRIGSRQIRNTGTLVGNIANASPIGDTPPMLLALDAELELTGGGQQRLINLSNFFIDYKKTELQQGEYIRRVVFTLPEPSTFLQSYKISKRYEDDISAVLLVVRWQVTEDKFTNVRVAVGGMAAIPKRVDVVEQVLEGAIVSQATIDAAKAAMIKNLQPISDVRASSSYRLQVVGNLLEKAWYEFQHPGSNSSVWQQQQPARQVTQTRGDANVHTIMSNNGASS